MRAKFGPEPRFVKKDQPKGAERLRGMLKQTSSALERKLEEVAALHQVSDKSIFRTNLSEILLLILSRALGEYRADSGLVLEIHQKTGEFVVKASLNLGPETLTKIVLSQQGGLLNLVAAQGKPAIVVDGVSNFGPGTETAIRNAILLPIMLETKAVGVLGLFYDAGFEHKVNFSDFGFLALLADHAAVAIRNVHAIAEFRTNYFSTIEALTVAIEAKDLYTRGHSARVAEYAIGAAKELGLPLDVMETIQTAAYLHDVGKIGIPESILLKSGKLSLAELEILRSHPVLGARILTPVAFYGDVVEIVEHHHERFDGSGYPFGKSQQRIPIGARVLSLADAFDAMTSDRPYRKMLSVAGAIRELKRCSNSQFDPDLVDAFVSALRKIYIR